MKKTLEYKILKYLFENDNNEFMKIVGIEKDSVLLNDKIVELKELNLIEYELVSDKPKIDNNGESFKEFFTKNPYLCKITFEGKKYLQNIESFITEIKLAKSNIKANNLNEKNSSFNKWTNIVNIILGIINVSLLIYQGVKTK